MLLPSAMGTKLAVQSDPRRAGDSAGMGRDRDCRGISRRLSSFSGYTSSKPLWMLEKQLTLCMGDPTVNFWIKVIGPFVHWGGGMERGEGREGLKGI